jgi:spermidine synthase
MTVKVSDGRHELLRTQKQFDLITLEPPPPSASGVVNLYSRDFYELAKSKLAPDGLLAQWWPLATQTMKIRDRWCAACSTPFPTSPSGAPSSTK